LTPYCVATYGQVSKPFKDALNEIKNRGKVESVLLEREEENI